MIKKLYFRVGKDDYDKFRTLHEVFRTSLSDSAIAKKRGNKLSMNKTFRLMVNMQANIIMPKRQEEEEHGQKQKAL